MKFFPSGGVLGDDVDDINDGGIGRDPGFDVCVVDVGGHPLEVGTGLLGIGDYDGDTDCVICVQHGG